MVGFFREVPVPDIRMVGAHLVYSPLKNAQCGALCITDSWLAFMNQALADPLFLRCALYAQLSEFFSLIDRQRKKVIEEAHCLPRNHPANRRSDQQQ